MLDATQLPAAAQGVGEVFRRRKKEPVEFDDVDQLDDQDPEPAGALLEPEHAEAPPVAPSRPQGPWDVADAPEDDVARIDLGGLLVPVPPDTEVRVDVSAEGEVVAATLVQGQAAVQVNAFAAPRTEGIWGEVLEEIAEQVRASGGSAERVEGALGPELRADVPTQTPDGRMVRTPARYTGVDGPRWFLRALYTGVAVDPAAAPPLERAVRDVVVVRGSDPMAVRDALPLRLPQEVLQEPVQDSDPDVLGLAERGPEITETR